MERPLGSLFVVLLLAIISVGPVLAASSTYEEGLNYYRSGRFKLALASFSAAVAENSSFQLSRYYLANCLVKCDEHERAAEEYKIAFLLDPHSPIGQYCRQALKSYDKRVRDLDLAALDAHAINFRAPSTVQQSGSRSGVLVDRTMSVIRRQASIEKDKYKLAAVGKQKVARSAMDEYAKQIDDDARHQIDKLYAPIIYSPAPRANPLLSNPALLKEKEEAILLEASRRKADLYKAGNERMDSYKDWQTNKEAALDEVTANLESQLTSPAGRHGVKLQPVGTDLYVRYYGLKPSRLIPETRAAVVRIISEGSGSEASGSRNGGQTVDSLKGSPDSESRNVQGKILKD